MKKSNLRLLAFVLFLVLAQNSIAANKVQEGNGSEAASDETVAVGLSYTDGGGTVHKNIAGNPAESGEKYYATAIGIANKASGKESSAFGFDNRASESRASAFGFSNKASGFMSSAFGYNNKAIGGGSSAFGHWNITKGINSSAFGFTNEASGVYSSAFGSKYKVTGNYSGAFGVGKANFNLATGKNDYDYVNEGKYSYMFGNYNKIAAGTQNNFILGNNVSIANGISNSVVLGNGSTVSSSNEVSVGSKVKKGK